MVNRAARIPAGVASTDASGRPSLRIVHVLAPARFGGLESVMLTLSRGQAAAGHQVTVVGTFTEDPAGAPFWEQLSAVPDVCAVPLVLGGRQYLAERRAVRDVLRALEPDVLHTHGYRPDVLAAPVARAMGVATVSTVHGFTGNDLKNRAYEWLQRRAYRRFDAVVAVSAKLERELAAAGVPARVLRCVPNAWAPVAPPIPRPKARRLLGLPGDTPLVGWIGRMSPEKAPDVALAAFEALEDRRAHLCFVGDGPMRPDLEARASGAGLADRVHWLGVVPDAGRYLEAFDALLLTSWTEGTPIVLFEAMAAGVPVVTTAVGGIPDVVSGAEAVLVQAGDAEGIALALRPILGGEPYAAQRARAARERLLRDFAVEPWVRRYDDIYRSCLTE